MTTTMYGFIILAIICTEKLIVTEVDGWTDGMEADGQKAELPYRTLL